MIDFAAGFLFGVAFCCLVCYLVIKNRQDHYLEYVKQKAKRPFRHLGFFKDKDK